MRGCQDESSSVTGLRRRLNEEEKGSNLLLTHFQVLVSCAPSGPRLLTSIAWITRGVLSSVYRWRCSFREFRGHYAQFSCGTSLEHILESPLVPPGCQGAPQGYLMTPSILTDDCMVAGTPVAERVRKGDVLKELRTLLESIRILPSNLLSSRSLSRDLTSEQNRVIDVVAN